MSDRKEYHFYFYDDEGKKVALAADPRDENKPKADLPSGASTKDGVKGAIGVSVVKRVLNQVKGRFVSQASLTGSSTAQAQASLAGELTSDIMQTAAAFAANPILGAVKLAQQAIEIANQAMDYARQSAWRETEVADNRDRTSFLINRTK